MDHQNYRHEGGHGYWVGKGQRMTRQAMRWNLMGEPTRWGSGGEKKVYCARCWSRVAVGDGDECAIDCLAALILEQGRPEGGKNPCWGKECPEGGEASARGLSRQVYLQHRPSSG